ncbi:hypothetical protein FACS189485_04500 [Spirochaetia bacterium]|nr:hypothetical protein FACS189485_04500 [Spirochaetia bacterium]
MVIFLLFAGWTLIGGQRAEAAPNVVIDDGIINAGTWLEKHLPPDTTEILLQFSSPTRDLTNYVTESIATMAADSGIHVTVQTLGNVNDVNAQTFGWLVDAQAVVAGDITPFGPDYQLELRTLDIDGPEVLSRYRTVVRMDRTLMILLHIPIPEEETPGVVANARAAQSAASDQTGSGQRTSDQTAQADEFSTGRRIGAAAMNPLLGLGSYTMGDWAGGLFTTMGYGMAVGLITWDIFGLEYDHPLAGAPGMFGIGVAGMTTAFGILRPFFYQKPSNPVDFSTGRRVGAAAMNLIFGLGSYTMGDVAGGLMITGGYTAAAGLILGDIFGLPYESPIAGIPGFLGIGVAGMTTIFGIFRPIFYNNPNLVPETFTAGRRAIGALLNPLFGIGSYTMGDWDGALVINGGYLTAASLILWDIYGLAYEDKLVGIPGAIGIGVAGATMIFGILRPIFYHGSGSQSKIAGLLKGAQLAIIPNASGIKAVRLSYSFQL